MCIGCGVAFFCIYLHLFAFFCITFFAISICISPPPPDTLLEVGMGMLLLPAVQAASAEQAVEVHRTYTTGCALLVADGDLATTADRDDLGWGSLVADSCGVLATVHSGVPTMSLSPWVAEWAGKLDVWDLATSVEVLPCEVQYTAGDCTSAPLGLDGGTPSDYPLVDHV